MSIKLPDTSNAPLQCIYGRNMDGSHSIQFCFKDAYYELNISEPSDFVPFPGYKLSKTEAQVLRDFIDRALKQNAVREDNDFPSMPLKDEDAIKLDGGELVVTTPID